jgi:hypothetical membrane protein
MKVSAMVSRWAATAWVCCFQFFVAEQIARLGWTGHYSMARDYISDLGTARSSLHWVMNGSFLLQGLLIFLGALGIRGFLPQLSRVLFAIAGVGVFLVGWVAEDQDAHLHIAGAVAHFLAGNAAMIVLGCAWMYRPEGKNWKTWGTLAAGGVGLLATAALGFRQSPSWHWGTGIVERLAAYPLPLWLTWTGYWLRKDMSATETQAGDPAGS